MARTAFEKTKMAGTSGRRELVGTFTSVDSLEAAISALASAGWDRAEMSLLAQRHMLEPSHVEAPSANTADDPRVPRGPVISDPDVRQGRVLAAGMGGVIAAFIASGATIMTGGTALAAVIGAAAAGGGASLAIDVFGRTLGDNRERFFEEQIDRGGILLWVSLEAHGREDIARDIMQRHGATHIHTHEGPAAT